MSDESNRATEGTPGWFLTFFLLTPLTACHVYETESFRRVCLSLAGITLVIAWIFQAALKRSIRWPLGPIGWVVAVLSLIHVAQSFRSLNPHTAFTALTLDLSCAALALALAAHAPWRAALFHFLPGIVTLIAALVSLAGIWQWLDFIPTECLGRVAKGYAPSLFGHGNNGGTFAGMFFPLVLASALSGAGLPRRALGWLCVSLLAFYIVLSHSRAGMLATIVSSALFFFLLRRSWVTRFHSTSFTRRLLIGIGAVCVMTAGLATVVKQEQGDDWIEHAVSTGSMNDRWTMWRNGLEIAGEYPLTGAGLGNFRAACYPHRARTELNRRTTREESHFFGLASPHNMYVLVLAEEGPVTLVLFLVVLWIALSTYWRSIRVSTLADNDSVWTAALASALVGFCIGGIFNSLSMSVAQSAFAWMAIGVLAGVSREGRPVSGGRAVGTVVAAAILLLFFAFATYMHIRFIAGRAGELEFLLSGNRARTILEQAIQEDPWNPNLRWRAGRLYLELREYDRSATEYEQILAWEPNNPHAHLNLGEALRGSGKLDAAAEAYRTSIRLAPRWPLSRQALAYIAFDVKDYVTADAEFTTLIDLDPRWPHYRYYHGLVLAMQGNYDQAAVRFREARDRGWLLRKHLKERNDSWLAQPQFQEFLRSGR